MACAAALDTPYASVPRVCGTTSGYSHAVHGRSRVTDRHWTLWGGVFTSYLFGPLRLNADRVFHYDYWNERWQNWEDQNGA